ncbi:MAG: hypothetical protein SGILL_001325 [Bacillariaceae sp.]
MVTSDNGSSSERENPHEETPIHGNGERLNSTLGPKKEDRVLRGKILHEVREMLRMSEVANFTDIVSWSKNGKTFRIHKRKLFQEQIMKKYLSCSKLAYLSDCLRSWGFCRLKQAKGEERNAYFHRLYHKDRPELCRNLTKDQMWESMKDFRGEQKLLEETDWSLLVPGAEIVDDYNSSEVRDGEGDCIDHDLDDGRQADSLGEYLGASAMSELLDNREEESSTPLPFLSQGPNSIDPIHCLGTNTAMQEAGYFFDTTQQSKETTAAGPVSSQTSGPATGFSFYGVKGSTYLPSLHMMLEESEPKGFAAVVSWQPHGRSFKVHDKQRFENDIRKFLALLYSMPKYFQGKLISFTRALISWGFLRLTLGKDRGSWYHRFFVRGATDLIKDFSCKDMSDAMKDWIAPGKEPDFQTCGSGDVLSEKLFQKKAGHQSNETNTEVDTEQRGAGISQNQMGKNGFHDGASADAKQNDPRKLRGTMVEDIRELLETARREQAENIVSWLLHGKAFKVHRRDAFMTDLLPRFLNCKKYENFADALRRWGFVKLKKNRDKGAFYHKLFQRDEPRLALHLSRNQMKTAMEDWRSPDDTEPNLYDGIPEDVLEASDQMQALRGKKKRKRKRAPSSSARKKACPAEPSIPKEQSVSV